MNRITAIWWNGCFGKMFDHAFLTIPNHHLIYQNGFFPKNFCSNHPCCLIVSAAFKSFPNQQRRPLPSLLSLSFFYALPPGARMPPTQIRFFFNNEEQHPMHTDGLCGSSHCQEKIIQFTENKNTVGTYIGSRVQAARPHRTHLIL